MLIGIIRVRHMKSDTKICITERVDGDSVRVDIEEIKRTKRYMIFGTESIP